MVALCAEAEYAPHVYGGEDSDDRWEVGQVGQDDLRDQFPPKWKFCD